MLGLGSLLLLAVLAVLYGGVTMAMKRVCV